MTDVVFAYGSNMDPAQLAKEGIEASRREAAVLPGHRLVWNYRSMRWGGGAANAEEAAGEDLSGVALFVGKGALERLDRKEGHPYFYRRAPRIRLATGEQVQAWCYLVVPRRLRPEPVWPTREYLDTVIRGARAHELPQAHVRRLEGTPTAPYSGDELPLSISREEILSSFGKGLSEAQEEEHRRDQAAQPSKKDKGTDE